MIIALAGAIRLSRRKNVETPENNKPLIGPPVHVLDKNVLKFVLPYSTFIYLFSIIIYFFSVYMTLAVMMRAT